VKGTWQTTDRSGGGLVVVVIVALVLIGSGALTAIMHALAVLLIAAAVAIPVTAVSIIALAATRTRSERPRRPDGPAWVSREPPAARPQLEVPDKRAIEPPPSAVEHHVHYHWHAAPDSPARIIAGRIEEDP
jgi:hypothetical protein